MNQAPAHNPWRLSVAPMLDWTDRHCRYFHRQLTQHTRLYTEMVTTGALLFGDQARHLDFNTEEHPVALQLGGSEPQDLAACVKLARRWGYDEVNLNCGCPSERVQRGAFGACLMSEPALVADCMKAMLDEADGMAVTLKHRIGVDRIESYEFARDFVGTVAQAGCSVFIVHARNAWLQGLSPKENREIPPLRYDIVHRLKREFPHLTIVINGGVKTEAEIAAQLQHVDGVMVGREAYHNPWVMSGWDTAFWGDLAREPRTREQVEAAMVRYCEERLAPDVPWSHVMRHVLGLYNGLPGARRWRQVWSDHRLKTQRPADVMRLAHERPQQAAAA